MRAQVFPESLDLFLRDRPMHVWIVFRAKAIILRNGLPFVASFSGFLIIMLEFILIVLDVVCYLRWILCHDVHGGGESLIETFLAVIFRAGGEC